MQVKRVALVGVVVLSFLGLGATAASASTPAAVTPAVSCSAASIVVDTTYYGGNGFTSPGWVKSYVASTGGCRIMAQAHCWNGFQEHYYQGNQVTTNGGTSTAKCGAFVDVLDGWQGWEYSANGTTWTKINTQHYNKGSKG